MASRKEQKEQARAARLAKERELAAKQTRTRRMQMFGGIVAVAVIVVVVVVVIAASGGGGSNSSGLKTGASAKHTISQVNSLLDGIPQSGTTLGNPKAKVTMTYFGDLECPICQEFTLDVLPQFIPSYVRTGKVKMTYKSFCTATCGGNYSEQQSMDFFDRQQVAAYAAGMQDKFWNYAELFYHQQKEEDTGYATNSYLTGLAKQVTGLNVAKWQSDRKDPTLLSQVSADVSLAHKENLSGTPSIIMTGSKGSELVNDGSVPSDSDLASAVKAVS